MIIINENQIGNKIITTAKSKNFFNMPLSIDSVVLYYLHLQ